MNCWSFVQSVQANQMWPTASSANERNIRNAMVLQREVGSCRAYVWA